MYRLIEEKLKEWSQECSPHPILLRGARQVGKSYVLQKIAEENFSHNIYINFELEPKYKEFFNDLDPKKIIKKICASKKQDLGSRTGLLILDEIQECPQAIQALRYFYEIIPELHVIAAGSLLEFTLQSAEFKMPVGRIQYLFLRPMSFQEFLLARNASGLLDFIKESNIESGIDSSMHQELLNEVRQYILVGGMPKVVDSYVKLNSYLKAFEEQKIILQTYRDDFGKYARKAKHQHLELSFNSIPHQASNKFKYARVSREIDSQSLNEALNLLQMAGVVHKIYSTNGEAPLAAGLSLRNFKALFLDIGLMQNILDLDPELIFQGKYHAQTAGGITEQLIGQELLANKEFNETNELFFWERQKAQSEAEVDYLIQVKGRIIPVEVKSGSTGTLKSLRMFMEKYKLPFGVRVSEHNLSLQDGILSVPFYAISELKRYCLGLL